MPKPKEAAEKPRKPQAKRTKQKTRAEYDELDKRIKKKYGAPSFPWSEELEDAICFEVATTPRRLKHILDANPDFPDERTFYKQLFNSPSFSEKYKLAKERQQDVKLESQHDELEWARNSKYFDKGGSERIDGGAVSLARLACDNIKWEASKLAPKKYGKLESEVEDETKKLRDELLAQVKILKND